MPLKSLKAISAATKRDDLKTHTADLSAMYEQEPGEVLLTWKQLDVPGRTRAQVLAQTEAKKRYPDWPVTLLLSVCTFTVSHEAPLEDNDSILTFYGDIAATNLELWDFIVSEYNAAFPNHADITAAVKAAKEMMTQEDFDTLHLCLTYLKKLPEDCHGLTVESLARLAAYDEMARAKTG